MRFLSTLIASTLGVLLALMLVVFLFFFFIFTLTLSADTTPQVADGSVLTIELDGPIPETVTDDPFARAFSDVPRHSLRGLKEALEKAAADDRIAGVWLQFKNLNAQWATLEEVRGALLGFKESGKPLYASSDDYAMTEAEYFLASTADSVFAGPQAFFEFNGFATILAFFDNTLEKLNIEPQIVRAGQFKSAVEPFLREDLSPENEQQLTALLQTTNTHFMQAVAGSRGLSAEALRRLASEAAVLTSQGALEADLLDALYYRDEVAALWRTRLGGYEADEELRTISLSEYARVPRSEAGLEAGGDGVVAVVYAEGQIVSGESETNPFSSAELLGAETFTEAMRTVRRSESIDAVVVRINSPGGSASASNAMWRAMDITAEQKPLIVSMGDVAASGGYWMATAADAVVADPLTITGSIGVFAVLFDASGFFNEKLGVTFDGVQTSPYADIFSGVRPLSEAERQLLEHFVDETYQAFLEKVAASTELTVAQVDSVAQGRIWTGAEALEIGLVDALGGLEEAIRMAASAADLAPGDYRTRAYPRPKPFFERLTDDLLLQANHAWLRVATSPAERLLMEQRRRLRQLTRGHGTVQALLPFEVTVE